MVQPTADDGAALWVCYSIAVVLGCFTRGVTGFGAGIAVLSVWALFAVLGAEVGPLEQIVALEGFTGLVTTLPMAFVVDMKGSASWLILGSFMPTQSACIPLGAALLTWVNPAALEKAAGVVILCFLATQTRLGAEMARGAAVVREYTGGVLGICGIGSSIGSGVGGIGGIGAIDGARRYQAVTGDDDDDGDDGNGDGDGKNRGGKGVASSSSSSNGVVSVSVVEVTTSSGATTTTKNGVGDGHDVEMASMPPRRSNTGEGDDGGGGGGDIEAGRGSSGREGREAAADGGGIEDGVVVVVAVAGAGARTEGTEGAERAAKRAAEGGNGGKGAKGAEGSALPAGGAAADTVAFAARDGAAVDDDDVVVVVDDDDDALCGWFERNHRWLTQRGPRRDMFAWRGSRLGFISAWLVGGVVSGVLGGMVGVHGPPAIALYSYLKIDKATVRATSTTMGTVVLFVRLISYVALGIMRIDDARLYGWCSVLGLAAVYSGHRASRFLDEKTFNGVMLVVLFLGAGLMLFKGFVGE